jgi:hypothetical protein
MENTIKKIISYFEENEETFNECIEELDSYNGYLGDDRYYEMDMINELFTDSDNIDLLNRAFFGRDDDNWYTDTRGKKIYGSFNPNRDYFYFNGYGNLVSSNYKDYTHKLDEYFVKALAENRSYIDTIENDEELTTLFDELENENGGAQNE